MAGKEGGDPRPAAKRAAPSARVDAKRSKLSAPAADAAVAATCAAAALAPALKSRPLATAKPALVPKPVAPLEDGSLDSALSDSAAPRKTTLQPDYLKTRRPCERLVIAPSGAGGRSLSASALSPRSTPLPSQVSPPISLPPSSSDVPPVIILGGPSSARSASAAPSGCGLASHSGTNAHPVGEPLEDGPANLNSRDRTQRKVCGLRVSWAVASELAQVREYVVADKKSAVMADANSSRGPEPSLIDFRAQQRSEFESERQALRIGQTLPCDAEQVLPRPTIQWVVPSLLTEKLWPSVKGDESLERDVQRRRRATAVEAPAIANSPSASIGEPPYEPTKPDSDTPALPLESVRVADVIAAPPPSMFAARSMGSLGLHSASCASRPFMGGIPAAATHLNQDLLGLSDPLGVDGSGGERRAGEAEGRSRGGSLEASVLKNFFAVSGGGAVAGGIQGGIGSGRILCSGMGGPMPGSGTRGSMVGGGSMQLPPGVPPCCNAAGGTMPGGGSLTEKLALQMALSRAATKPIGPAGSGQPTACYRSSGYGQHAIGPSSRDQSAHPSFRTKPCRYFEMGGCKNGDRCTFKHVLPGKGASGTGMVDGGGVSSMRGMGGGGYQAGGHC